VANVVEFTAMVRGGKIPLETSMMIRDCLAKLKDATRIQITIREEKPQRSKNQNAYYWAVVVPIVHRMFVDAGNDMHKDEVHELLKQEVGGNTTAKVVITPDGKRKVITKSSSKLNTQEWEDFMEKIRAWAAQFQVIIPLPNEDLSPRTPEEDTDGTD
jgi:hypothetical protein